MRVTTRSTLTFADLPPQRAVDTLEQMPRHDFVPRGLTSCFGIFRLLDVCLTTIIVYHLGTTNGAPWHTRYRKAKDDSRTLAARIAPITLRLAFPTCPNPPLQAGHRQLPRAHPPVLPQHLEYQRHHIDQTYLHQRPLPHRQRSNCKDGNILLLEGKLQLLAVWDRS